MGSAPSQGDSRRASCLPITHQGRGRSDNVWAHLLEASLLSEMVSAGGAAGRVLKPGGWDLEEINAISAYKRGGSVPGPSPMQNTTRDLQPGEPSPDRVGALPASSRRPDLGTAHFRLQEAVQSAVSCDSSPNGPRDRPSSNRDERSHGQHPDLRRPRLQNCEK